MQIYQIINKTNGKSYIGKTEKTFEHRYSKNWWNLVSNSHLKRSLKKYGIEAFEVKILSETEDAKHQMASKRKPIAAYNIQTGLEVLRFESIDQACNKGFPKIRRALKVKNIYKGYIWRHLNG